MTPQRGNQTSGAESGVADQPPEDGGGDIELVGVEKRFGTYVAVEDATFDIPQGEFFSMLGPSGCGKTTTLRMIAGFETPTAGRILLGGQDVSRVPPYKRDVNTVFQHYGLFPHMSVLDNVAFGLRSKGMARMPARQQAHDMLELVRLDGFDLRKPSQLSGGQQQRVALARALVNRPKALLLDEPLGALDLKLRQSMQLELKRIQRELGITFVFVTHDQEEALTMSDRIAVMTQGRTDQIGSPVDIYHHPSTVFVAGFIGTANLFPVRVESQDGDIVTVGSALGATFHVDANGARFDAGTDVTMMVRPERFDLSAQEPQTPVGGVTAALLQSVVFQGPVLRCEAVSTSGTTIVAHVHTDDMPTDVAVGQTVYFSWIPGGAHLVNEKIDSSAAGVVTAADDETATSS